LNPYLFIIGCDLLFAIGLLFFTLTTSVYLAYIFLFVVGFSLVGTFAMTNTTIQHSVSDHMRGRVMSIYALSFMGLAPLGNFEIGYVAEKFGSQFAIQISAVVIFIFGIYLYMSLKEVKKDQEVYNKKNISM